MNDHDPCDDFLGTRFTADAEALRDRLRRQTTGVLRRRRWARRLGAAAALAACYLAGVLTTRLVPTPPRVIVLAPGPAPPAAEVVHTPDEAADDDVPPLVLEHWGAAHHGSKRVAYFRQAGDRYYAGGDLSSALRCYRHALDAGTDQDLEIVADRDNALLMNLKIARRKERTHERTDG